MLAVTGASSSLRWPSGRSSSERPCARLPIANEPLWPGGVTMLISMAATLPVSLRLRGIIHAGCEIFMAIVFSEVGEMRLVVSVVGQGVVEPVEDHLMRAAARRRGSALRILRPW